MRHDLEHLLAAEAVAEARYRGDIGEI